MKVFGAALVFFAELGMYAGYAVLGWSLGGGSLRLVWAVALPLVVAVAWGLFLSPKAARALPPGPKVVARLALMLGGAVAAWLAGSWWLAVAVVVCGAVGTVLAGDTKDVAEVGRQ